MNSRIIFLFCLTSYLSLVFGRELSRQSPKCQTPESRDGSEFVCPEPDGMFAHKECTKFWHCSNCYAYVKDCPSILHWNNAKQECDWPKDANCPQGPAEEGPTTTGAPTEETTTEGSSDSTTNEETTTDQTTTEGSTGDDSTTDSSTTDGNSDGTTQESTDTPIPEEPSTTDSTGTDGTTTDETTSDGTTTDGTTTDETTTADSTTVGSPEAPGLVCTADGYYEHENCRKFWQCSHGIAYEQDCAPGTAWNQEKLTCDWPSEVSCAAAEAEKRGKDWLKRVILNRIKN